MSDVPEALDVFFAPLVGSEAAIADLQTTLSEKVQPYAESELAFLGLETAASEIVQTAIFQANDLPPDDDGRRLLPAWKAVWVNGYQGVNFTTSGLETVSSVFAKHAKVPQTQENVQTNTDRILRHILHNAFNRGAFALHNQIALRTGRNPRNVVNNLFIAMNGLRQGTHDTSIHPRALRVKTNEDGQLDIQPKHKLLVAKSGQHCPAADSRISVPGESPSALLTFMRAVGTVAIQDIFPHKFPIMPSA